MQTEPFEVDVSVACPILQIELQHLVFPEETERLLLKHVSVSGTTVTVPECPVLCLMFLCVRNSIPMNTKF